MTEQTLEAWLAHAEATHPQSIDMGLERVREVARRLGVLTVHDRTNIIVAGTNGKGSTTTACEALLLELGCSVGATLSPHVHRFNERVRVNGIEVDDATLCAGFAAVEQARGSVALTYFEFATLVALKTFADAGVEFAILEIGLGGRLDAFNIIDADLAIITSIGLDHQEYLGTDLETIGAEKAGVLRQGQTVVLGAVTDSVRTRARALDCHALELGVDFSITQSAKRWSYERHGDRELSFRDLQSRDLAPTNFALALTAVAELREPERVEVDAALERAMLPGRFERRGTGPRPLVLDVAHNPAAAAFLATQLATHFPGRRFVAVLGMLQGKDACGVVQQLRGHIDCWCLAPTVGPRGCTTAALDASLQASLDIDTRQFASVEAALQGALSLCSGEGGILVLGSFSVVEQARDWLLHAPEVNPDFTAESDAESNAESNTASGDADRDGASQHG